MVVESHGEQTVEDEPSRRHKFPDEVLEEFQGVLFECR